MEAEDGTGQALLVVLRGGLTWLVNTDTDQENALGLMKTRRLGKLRDPELEIVSEIEERDWVEIRQVVLVHDRLPGGPLVFTPQRTEASSCRETGTAVG